MCSTTCSVSYGKVQSVKAGELIRLFIVNTLTYVSERRILRLSKLFLQELSQSGVLGLPLNVSHRTTNYFDRVNQMLAQSDHKLLAETNRDWAVTAVCIKKDNREGWSATTIIYIINIDQVHSYIFEWQSRLSTGTELQTQLRRGANRLGHLVSSFHPPLVELSTWNN